MRAWTLILAVGLLTTGLVGFAPAAAAQTPAPSSCELPGPDSSGFVCDVTTGTWLDTAGGTALSLGNNDAETIPLPFGFTWYGETFTTANVGSNGLICFEPAFPCDQPNNQATPDPSSPNDLIACLWTDLQATTATGVHYDTFGTSPTRVIAVSWDAIDHTSGGGTNTFQVQLTESGEARCVYQAVTAGDAQQTVVGTENGDGTEGLRYTSSDFTSSALFAVVFGQVPSAPQSLTAVMDGSNVELSWNAPAQEGTSSLIQYNIYRDDTTGVYDDVPAGTTELTDSDVDPDTTYTYTVTAVNSVGESPVSNDAEVTTPDVPAAIADLDATAGTDQSELSWTAPDDGGSVITSYDVYRQVDGGALELIETIPAPATGYSDTEIGTIPCDVTLSYEVTATNAMGTGPTSNAAQTPSHTRCPDAPTNVDATADGLSLKVSWDAPADPGTSAITTYTIHRSDNAGGAQTVVGTVGGSSTSFTDPDVDICGATYTYHVSATNAGGEGPQSDPSSALTPVRCPGAPTIVGVSDGPGDDSLRVDWDPPTDPGTTPVVSYTVYKDGVLQETKAAGTTTAVLTGLDNTTAHCFQLSATNDHGEGARSPQACAGPPDPPQDVEAAGDAHEAIAFGAITVSWTVPADNGSLDIEGYNVYAGLPGVLTVAPDKESVGSVDADTFRFDHTPELPGLYCYQVTASNAFGQSGPSESPVESADALLANAADGAGLLRTCSVYVPADEAISPEAPQTLVAVAQPHKVDLSWDAPQEGTPTQYHVERREHPNGGWVRLTDDGDVPATETEFTDRSVDRGLTYCFRVIAQTGFGAFGESDPSNEACVTTLDLPGAPENVAAEGGPLGDQITVTWDPPADNGGDPIASYQVFRAPDEAGSTLELVATVPAGELTYTDTVPEEGTYCYSIVAQNGVGLGPASSPGCAGTLGFPEAPVVSPTSGPGNLEVSLAWTAPDDGGEPITLYRVYRTTDPADPDPPLRVDVPAPTTSLVDKEGLTCQDPLHYAVSAENARGEGPRSALVVATPGGCTAATGELTATAGPGRGAIGLSWTAPTSGTAPDGYVVLRADSGAGPFEEIARVDDGTLSHFDTGLTDGLDYHYVVHAFDDATGNGPPSNVASATTWDHPDAPTALTVSGGNGAPVDLDWEEPPSDGGTPLTGYTVYAGLPELPLNLPDPTRRTIELAPGTTSYRDVPPTPGPVCYKVTATNLVGEGPATTQDASTHCALFVPPGGSPDSPDAPSVEATAPGTFRVSWDAPPIELGLPDPTVTTYHVFRCPADPTTSCADETDESAFVEIATTGPVTTRLDDTVLANAVRACYRVSAQNLLGEGPPSAPTCGTTLPGAPTDVTAAPAGGGDDITVTWTAPADAGDQPLTGFTVYRDDVAVHSAAATETSWTDDDEGAGLDPTDHCYTVTASNAGGEGPASDPPACTRPIFTPPDAPTGVAATNEDQGAGELLAEWTAPDDDGGDAVTEYRIYRDGGATPVGTVPGTADPLEFVDTGLASDTEYCYEITAVNDNGESSRSSPVACATTHAPPDAPTGLTAERSTSAAGTLALAWDAPAEDGGVPITGYRIYRCPADASGACPDATDPDNYGEIATVPASETSYDDAELPADTELCYQVATDNDAGTGPRSAHACATTHAVPGAPTGVTASRHPSTDGVLQVSWTKPADDGGRDVTSYDVHRFTCPDASCTGRTDPANYVEVGTSASTSFDDGDVESITRYCYIVSAHNDVGEGPTSEVTAPQTECAATDGPPAAPTLDSVEAGPGLNVISLDWAAPGDDGGSPITAYRIYRAGLLLDTVDASARAYTDAGLANGITMCYQVAATNAFGEGPLSSPDCATTFQALKPTAPLGLTAQPTLGPATDDGVGLDTVQLAWNAPDTDADPTVPPATTYKVYECDDNGRACSLVATVAAPTTDHGVGPLDDLAYVMPDVRTFRVSAVNDVGEGPRSALACARPAPWHLVDDPLVQLGLMTPCASVPTELTAQPAAGPGTVELSWTAPERGGVSAYNVYRDGALLATVPADTTTYTDTSEDVGARTYHVTAVYADGAESGPSNEAHTVALGDTVPALPRLAITFYTGADEAGEACDEATEDGRIDTADPAGSTLPSPPTAVRCVRVIADDDPSTPGEVHQDVVLPTLPTAPSPALQVTFFAGFDDEARQCTGEPDGSLDTTDPFSAEPPSDPAAVQCVRVVADDATGTPGSPGETSQDIGVGPPGTPTGSVTITFYGDTFAPDPQDPRRSSCSDGAEPLGTLSIPPAEGDGPPEPPEAVRCAEVTAVLDPDGEGGNAPVTVRTAIGVPDGLDAVDADRDWVPDAAEQVVCLFENPNDELDGECTDTDGDPETGPLDGREDWHPPLLPPRNVP